MTRQTRFEIAAADLLREHQVQVRAIVASGEGVSYAGRRLVDVPRMDTPEGFITAAHETGHAIGRPYASPELAEIAAWRWALAQHAQRALPGRRRAVAHATRNLVTYLPGESRVDLRRLLTDPAPRFSITTTG